MNVNILEEYLVKIGAEVDQNAFQGAANAIQKLSELLKGVDSFLRSAAIPVALGAITAAVAQNIKAVAALDLEYQKLAKNMWVTKETAKSLKLAMDIMGASEEDIAWVPELREQFFRLRSEMQALATPQDADSQLRWIRDIGYDIQSLQLKLKMFREWLDESVEAIERVLNSITILSDTLAKFSHKLDISGLKTDNFFERVGKAISASLMNIPALINVLAKLFSAVDKALQGNWGGAFGELAGAVNDLVNTKTEEFKAIKNIWIQDDKNRRKLVIPDDIWDEGLKKTNKDLIAALERINAKVYAEFGKSLEVTGGFRTPTQNAEVGGVSNSKHLTGYAVDLNSEMWSKDERAKIDAWAQEEGLYTLRHNAGTGDHWHFQMNQDEKHGGSGGSYALSPTSYAANMAALPSSYAASMVPNMASGSAMSFSIGAINVTVTNSNASAQEIASAVGSEFKNNVAGYLAANGTGVTFI